MSPYQQAQAIYEREQSAQSFAADLELHLRHGYVVSTPQAFAMARPVWSGWATADLLNPYVSDPKGDCWWIWCLAGDLGIVVRWLPWPTEWLGFERRNVPRLVKWDRLKQLSVCAGKRVMR